MIYFIGADGLPFVKVGYAQNIQKRLAGLQVGQPFDLTVLGATEGGRRLEKCIHRLLRDHHQRGEWFERAPALHLLVQIVELGVERAIAQCVERQQAIQSSRKAERQARHDLIGATTAAIVGDLVERFGLAAVAEASGLTKQAVMKCRRGACAMNAHSLFSLQALDPEALAPLFAIAGLRQEIADIRKPREVRA